MTVNLVCFNCFVLLGELASAAVGNSAGKVVFLDRFFFFNMADCGSELNCQLGVCCVCEQLKAAVFDGLFKPQTDRRVIYF